VLLSRLRKVKLYSSVQRSNGLTVFRISATEALIAGPALLGLIAFLVAAALAEGGLPGGWGLNVTAILFAAGRQVLSGNRRCVQAHTKFERYRKSGFALTGLPFCCCSIMKQAEILAVSLDNPVFVWVAGLFTCQIVTQVRGKGSAPRRILLLQLLLLAALERYLTHPIACIACINRSLLLRWDLSSQIHRCLHTKYAPLQQSCSLEASASTTGMVKLQLYRTDSMIKWRAAPLWHKSTLLFRYCCLFGQTVKIRLSKSVSARPLYDSSIKHKPASMRLLIALFFRPALLPQVYDLVATLCIADLRKFEMIVHHSLAILLAFFLLRDEYAHYYAVFFLGMTEVRCVPVYTY
jgi:hypothetical protein